MTGLALAVAAAALLSAPAPVVHPGHGSDRFVGTLKSVNEDDFTLEFRDLGTMALRRVRILVTEETKFRVGKEPVDSLEPMVGMEAEVAVNYEEGPTGETVYRATEVKFSKSKKDDKD